MNAHSRRVERLYGALTGKEAAKIALARYKAHEPFDPAVSAGLRGHQADEYNRLVRIMNFVNGELSEVVLLVGAEVTQQEIRMALFLSLYQHARDLDVVRMMLDECVREPVTESELPAKRKNAPRWKLFDVYPDEDADEVEALRKNWKLLRGLFDLRAADIALPLVLPEDGEELGTDRPLDLLRQLAGVIRDGLDSAWTQLNAVDIVSAQYAEEFDGESVWRPSTRERLDDALGRIQQSRDALAEFIGPWALRDDHSDAIALIRRLAERVLE